MNRTAFLILLSIFLIVNNSWSQESTSRLEGRILDSHGQAIALVNVSISSPNLQGVRNTMTNTRGYFLLLVYP